MPARNYASTRYSSLSQIIVQTVKQLQLAWMPLLMSSPISAIALVLVLSCVSPEQKAALAAHDIRSWAATARMTAGALEAGTVPRHYALQVLDAAVEGRRQLAQRPEWDATAPELRDSLQSSLRDLALALGQPADSVGVTP